MRSVFAAVAGLFLGGVLVMAFSSSWELAESMWRDRLFLASFNAIVLGWLLGLLLCKPAASRPLLPFGLGMLASLLFGGPILIGLGLAVLVLSLRRLPADALHSSLRPLGLLAHLALPLALLLPVNEAPNAVLEAPPLAVGPATTAKVSEQTPDVLFVVVDTLRADALLDANVPTPHLDALREEGTWAQYAVAPANQTLPSHLCLFMGLDILKIGQRGNLSRWPTAEQLRVEWEGRSLAHRMADLGYRTAAVTSNPLLNMVPESDPPYQSFEDGFQTWAPVEKVQPWPIFLKWARARTPLGFVAPNRLLSFLLTPVLNRTARRNFIDHVGEGTVTTDHSLAYLSELQQSEAPYFFCAQYFDPHSPYVAQPPFAGTLARPELAPSGFDGGYQADFDMRVQMRHALREGATVESQASISDFQHRLYLEEVAYLDAELGRLFAAVKQSGRPTMVVFTADHGEGFGRHRNVEHGESLHEEELLVPMVLWGSGVPQAQLAGQVDMVDATRTILERVGANADYVDGRNLLAQTPASKDWQLSVRIGEVCLRSQGWKLIMKMRYEGEHHPDDAPLSEEAQKSKVKVEQGKYTLAAKHLFFLPVDRHEQQDLLAVASDGSNAEAAAQLARLEALLREQLDEDYYPSLPLRTLSPKEREALAEIGYTD